MKRNPRSKLYKVLRIIGVTVILLLFLGSLGWVYRSNFLTSSLEVEIAKQGSIDHLQNVSAVFANEETLLTTPKAGTPKFLVQEGERVRRGDVIAVIESEGATLGQAVASTSQQVEAPVGGIVFSSIDGLETYLTPENLVAMDVGKILEYSASANSEGVAGGGVIGKIVNNLKPTVALLKVETKGFAVGDSVKLVIDEERFTAKILRLVDDPPGIVVQFNQYVNGSGQERLKEVALVTKPSVSGILIPKSSLWFKGEEQGVYVVVNGAIQYRKVKILDQNEEYLVVENLPHGIPVITNPRMGLDGLVMNLKMCGNPKQIEIQAGNRHSL